MAVRTWNKALTRAIEEERAWTKIDHPLGGEAQVAETVYNGWRLVVRRTRLTAARQARLCPDWRRFGFLTDLGGDAVAVAAFQRHAEVELAIRYFKEGAGMEHVPTGRFARERCLACCAVLAHNLMRSAVTIGDGSAQTSWWWPAPGAAASSPCRPDS